MNTINLFYGLLIIVLFILIIYLYTKPIEKPNFIIVNNKIKDLEVELQRQILNLNNMQKLFTIDTTIDKKEAIAKYNKYINYIKEQELSIHTLKQLYETNIEKLETDFIDDIKKLKDESNTISTQKFNKLNNDYKKKFNNNIIELDTTINKILLKINENHKSNESKLEIQNENINSLNKLYSNTIIQLEKNYVEKVNELNNDFKNNKNISQNDFNLLIKQYKDEYQTNIKKIQQDLNLIIIQLETNVTNKILEIEKKYNQQLEDNQKKLLININQLKKLYNNEVNTMNIELEKIIELYKNNLNELKNNNLNEINKMNKEYTSKIKLINDKILEMDSFKQSFISDLDNVKKVIINDFNDIKNKFNLLIEISKSNDSNIDNQLKIQVDDIQIQINKLITNYKNQINTLETRNDDIDLLISNYNTQINLISKLIEKNQNDINATLISQQNTLINDYNIKYSELKLLLEQYPKSSKISILESELQNLISKIETLKNNQTIEIKQEITLLTGIYDKKLIDIHNKINNLDIVKKQYVTDMNIVIDDYNSKYQFLENKINDKIIAFNTTINNSISELDIKYKNYSNNLDIKFVTKIEEFKNILNNNITENNNNTVDNFNTLDIQLSENFVSKSSEIDTKFDLLETNVENTITIMNNLKKNLEKYNNDISVTYSTELQTIKDEFATNLEKLQNGEFNKVIVGKEGIRSDKSLVVKGSTYVNSLYLKGDFVIKKDNLTQYGSNIMLYGGQKGSPYIDFRNHNGTRNTYLMGNPKKLVTPDTMQAKNFITSGNISGSTLTTTGDITGDNLVSNNKIITATIEPTDRILTIKRKDLSTYGTTLQLWDGAKNNGAYIDFVNKDGVRNVYLQGKKDILYTPGYYQAAKGIKGIGRWNKSSGSHAIDETTNWRHCKPGRYICGVNKSDNRIDCCTFNN